MKYSDAVEIVKELADKFRRYEYYYEGISKVNEEEYKYWAEALETVLEGNQDRIFDNRDDSIDLKNYYDRAKDIAENILKGDKNDGT